MWVQEGLADTLRGLGGKDLRNGFQQREMGDEFRFVLEKHRAGWVEERARDEVGMHSNPGERWWSSKAFSHS